MSEELEFDVRMWAAQAPMLSEYDEYLEVSGALVWRDEIQKALDAGEPLSSEYRAMLREADDKLMAQREELVSRFPYVFTPDRQEAGPHSYWWWFLNEGPQVREKAERAA